ncbi:DUF4307 domain-containing protein [Actinomadura rugatobispora]|uniref:DUF4307 domain-containing protein n=1 Tax=Actinomadura rugatobispora TaxID=1994 RepID=A0ABW1AD65_9ACTN
MVPDNVRVPHGDSRHVHERHTRSRRRPGLSGGGPGAPAGDGPSGDGGGPEGGRRRGSPLGYALIGLLAVVMAAGWAVVVGHANNTPGIAAQTITFVIQNDSSVQVTYAVAKSREDVVRCTVDAFDTDFAIVASSEITVPAGTEKIQRTDTLRTSKRATGARVKDCRKV